MRDYIKIMQEQFGGKRAAEGEEEAEEPAEAAPVGFVPDLLDDANVYQWAGIGFGQQELYRLQKSLKKLAADSGAAKLKFFGKIRGTDNDYYIAEGEVEGGEEAEGEEKPADFEAKGSGINKMTYWVSHSSFDKWVMLPDISPADMGASRRIKILFTGDLERPIFADPYFFKAKKTEKHYLRAQIARIVHSTTLCPKGLFRLQEDSTKEIEDNAPEDGGDIPLPSTKAMANPSMWVHYTVGILKNNRTAHMEPEVPEGMEIEPEELLKQIEAKDPYEPRLKEISQDSPVVVSKNQKINPWVVKEMGDSTEYKTENGKIVSNGVIVVRSLQWPGSFNFYYQGKYMNIYVGNGHKYEVASYFPVNPPVVLQDPEEYDIQPEPTPLEEPVPVE
jgi:radial spoke head protein 4/6